jgi:hypothetical protein
MQNKNVKLATYPDVVKAKVGETRAVDGVAVEYVCYGQPCHIRFVKYTSDYRQWRSRPYVVESTGQGYAKLDNAVRALLKHGFNPI